MKKIKGLEFLIKSQENFKKKGVLTKEGKSYLAGLKTAYRKLKGQ